MVFKKKKNTHKRPNKTCQWAGFNPGLPVRNRLSPQMALEWPGSQSHSSHRTCFLSVTPEACSYTQVCLFFNQPPSQPHGILRKTRENSAGKAYLFPSIFLFWKEEDDWTNDSSFSFLFKKMAQDVIIPSERRKLFWKRVCPQAVC